MKNKNYKIYNLLAFLFVFSSSFAQLNKESQKISIIYEPNTPYKEPYLDNSGSEPVINKSSKSPTSTKSSENNITPSKGNNPNERKVVKIKDKNGNL